MEYPNRFMDNSKSPTGGEPMKLHGHCTMHAKRAKKGQLCGNTTDLKSSTYVMRREGFEPPTA